MSAFTDLAAGRGQVPVVVLPRARFELDCGASLVVSARPSAPITAVRVHLRGGRSQDALGKEGTAFLAGTLADQGTDLHDEMGLATLLEPAGGGISGDASGFSGAIQGDSWGLLLDTMAEVLLGAAYPAGPVKRQQQRILARMEAQAADPHAQAARRFRALVYGKNWLGQPVSGTVESLSSITPADLRRHRKRHWRPERALIAVCGDVDPEKVRRKLNRLLRSWKKGRPFEPKPLRFPKRAVRVDAFHRKREQVHVYLGHLGIRRADPDYAALTVMDHVLGTGPGFTNRITRLLRDELGLAYSVQADIHSSAGTHPGIFRAYIGTSPQHLPTAVRGFLREIHRIRDEVVGEEELRVARDFVVGSFALGFERAGRRAAFLVASELHSLPDDVLETLPKEIAAVTAEDVQRVANQHLHPDKCCLSVAGPVRKQDLRPLL